jgi:hypothetical protein
MIQNRRSGYQRVTYLQAVTLAILTEIIAGLAACLKVDGRAEKSAKKFCQCLVFARPRSGPQFR